MFILGGDARRVVLPAAQPTLIVAEVVNPAVIGDGPRAGRSCSLLRLGGCNLACTWCDVPESWEGGRYDLQHTLPRRVVHHLLDELAAPRPHGVLLTGGEPLLQQRSEGWYALLTGLADLGLPSELHTNGTKVPGEVTLWGVSRFVVSPKLAHSGEPAWTRVVDDAMAAWVELARAGRADFSFVVRDRTDVVTVNALAGLHGVPPHAIFVSPQGRTPAEVAARTAAVAETVLSLGYSLAPRVLLSPSAATGRTVGIA